MKIIEGLEMRQLGNDYVVLAESVKLINFNKMLALNETAAYLWSSVAGKDFEVEDLEQLLMEKYDIDHETAQADAQNLVKAWKESGVIEG